MTLHGLSRRPSDGYSSWLPLSLCIPLTFIYSLPRALLSRGGAQQRRLQHSRQRRQQPPTAAAPALQSAALHPQAASWQ